MTIETHHFASVVYWNDGLDILGIYSDIGAALEAHPDASVQEWNGQKMRRWWSLDEHSEWEDFA